MSTSSNPVAADQQVSTRRSVSASISSAARGTKSQPAPSKPCAPPQQRQQRAHAGFAGAHAQAREHGANQVQAAIDVTADEELLGAAPLQLDALRVIGSAAARR